jgi:hypothetical protein
MSHIVHIRIAAPCRKSIWRLTGFWSLFLGLCLLPGVARAMDCSNLPTSFSGDPFPTGDFFSNFNNPCYTISLATGNGVNEYGDLNAQYSVIYYKSIRAINSFSWEPSQTHDTIQCL